MRPDQTGSLPVIKTRYAVLFDLQQSLKFPRRWRIWRSQAFLPSPKTIEHVESGLCAAVRAVLSS